jgi:hypothetical protein
MAAIIPIVAASVPNSLMMGGWTRKKKFRKFEFIANTSHKANIASHEYFEPPRKSFFTLWDREAFSSLLS